MTERRFKPVATTRIAALATSTSILKRHGSVAILLLFLLAAMTNAHATATTTTTTITAPAASSISAFGASVTLTATVSPSTAAGTVQFKSNGTAVGSACTLASGTCHIASTTLAVGSDSLTAVFAPTSAAAFVASTATAVSVTITSTTTTALAATVNGAAIPAGGTASGSSVLLTATVAPAASTGSVTFMNGSTTLGTSNLSSGVATLAVTALPVATNSVTAIYAGNGTYLTSTSTAVSVKVVAGTSSTTALAASAATIASGASEKLTATVTPAAAAGSVTFYDGSTSLGNGTIATGTATLSLTTLSAGSHSITATYNGSATYDPSNSSATTVNVTVTTTTGLAATVNGTAIPAAGAASGSSVLLTATMNPLATTGSVTFMNGSASLGTGALSSGVATLTVKNLPVATNSLTAVYGANAPYTGSTSTAVSVKVIAGTATTTTLGISSANIVPSATETLTATVTVGATGSVTFYDGSTALNTVALSGSTPTATLATSTLSVGAHSITAVYNGNASDDPSTSSAKTVTVAAPETTTLSVPVGAHYYGVSVTFTANVSPAPSSGSVTFLDNGTSVGTGTLSSGTATLSLTTLAVGSHPITASYTANGSTSTSGSTSVSVIATPTAIALSASVSTTTASTPFNLTATLTPAMGTATVSSGSVTFYDSATLLGKSTVNGSGVATLTGISVTAPGAHYLIASYGGVYSSGIAEFGTSLSLSAKVTISSAQTITFTQPAAGTYGGTATLSATSTSGLAVTFTASGACSVSGTTLSFTGVGVNACTVTAQQAGNASYNAATPVPYTVTVSPATQAIGHWFNSSTTYGAPVLLSATATSGGTVVYSVVSGPGAISGSTLTPSGVGTITVGATVPATADYTAVTVPVSKTVTVYQAPLVITASSPSTVAIGGTVPTINPTFATFVGTDTASSLTTGPTCTTNYKANSAPGAYTTNCSGASDSKYSITYVSGSFTVSKAAQTIRGFYNSSTLYGTPLTFTATASSTLPVVYTVASGPGTISGSILTPTGAGAIVVNANQAGNSGYTPAPQVQVSVVVYQLPLVITASTPSAITFGTAVPAITATAVGFVNSDTYTTPPTCFTAYTISGANSHPATYSTTCYGAVNPKYSISYTAGSLTVNQAPATVSVWPTATAIAYGHALSTSAWATPGSTSVVGTFAWTPNSTIPHVGYSYSVTFTPTSSTDYTIVTGTVAANVNPVTPTISTLPTASSIPYNSPLSASNLTGGAATFTLPSASTVTVPGTIHWTNGSPLQTNISTINSEGVTFTPTGIYLADYNTATSNVNVVVTKATSSVSVWPTAATITYGAALSTSGLTGGTANPGGGVFTWASGATVPAAGTPSESVTYTPSDTTHYGTVTGTVKVTVNKATPTVSSWPTASAVTYPATLASSNLTGGSTAGKFTWTTSTTTPTVGGGPYPVTFTPTNSTDYTTVPGTVAVTVNPAATTVSAWPTAEPLTFGQTLASSGWATTGEASTDGTFVWTDNTVQPGVGTASYSVTFTPSSPDFSIVNGGVNVTVNACGYQDIANTSFSTALNVETGSQTMSDPTLDAEGINESAVCDATPSDTTIVTYPFITSNAQSTWAADSNSYGTDAAVLAYGTEATQGSGATITINDDGAGDPGSISTSQNNSSGVVASMGGTVNITDTVINTSGNNAHALDATYAGTLSINNVAATTTGDNSSVIATGIGGGFVTVNGGSYTATSSSVRSSGIRAAGTGSTITVNDGSGSGTTITAQNGEAVIIEGGNTVTINSNGSTTLSAAAGQQNNGIYLYQGTLGDAAPGTSTFNMTNGSISYTCDETVTSSCASTGTIKDQNIPASVFAVTNTTGIINLTDVTVLNDTPYNPQSGPEDTNGTLLTASALSQAAGGNVTFNASGETLTGDVVVDAISSATLNLAADTASTPVSSTLTGAINAANSGGTVNLTLDATSSWVAANGPSYLTTLTGPGATNVNCFSLGQCSVYVAGVLQTSIQ